MILKMSTIALALIPTLLSHAAAETVYQVTVETLKAGKKVNSSSLVILEGQKGEIKNVLADATGTYFEVTIHRGPAKKLSLDYRYKDRTSKQTLEIAKTAVEFTPGIVESSKLKDTGGNDLELNITVREGAPSTSEKVKQKIPLGDH